jgi:excisionase family DNA binding protein
VSALAAQLIAELDDGALDALAAALAPRLASRLGQSEQGEPGGYVDVAGAAEFLACPPSRIYALVSAKRIPHYRDGSRLLFDRGELPEYVRHGGARRP